MMKIQVISFGFKYGQPDDAQLQFDVRCLPNPYYVSELRPMCGLDAPVAAYVMQYAQSQRYLDAMYQVVNMTAELLQEKACNDLIVYVGCTGGRHRSVTLACALVEKLEQAGWYCSLQHRQLAQETRQ